MGIFRNNAVKGAFPVLRRLKSSVTISATVDCRLWTHAGEDPALVVIHDKRCSLHLIDFTDIPIYFLLCYFFQLYRCKELTLFVLIGVNSRYHTLIWCSTDSKIQVPHGDVLFFSIWIQNQVSHIDVVWLEWCFDMKYTIRSWRATDWRSSLTAASQTKELEQLALDCHLAIHSMRPVFFPTAKGDQANRNDTADPKVLKGLIYRSNPKLRPFLNECLSRLKHFCTFSVPTQTVLPLPPPLCLHRVDTNDTTTAPCRILALFLDSSLGFCLCLFFGVRLLFRFAFFSFDTLIKSKCWSDTWPWKEYTTIRNVRIERRSCDCTMISASFTLFSASCRQENVHHWSSTMFYIATWQNNPSVGRRRCSSENAHQPGRARWRSYHSAS